jgi:hypothetical protein
LTQGLCSGCMSRKKSLLDRFDSHVDKRSNTLPYQQKLDLMYLEVIPCNRTKQNIGWEWRRTIVCGCLTSSGLLTSC